MLTVETERIEELIASIVELAPPDGRLRAIARQRVERLVVLARETEPQEADAEPE